MITRLLFSVLLVATTTLSFSKTTIYKVEKDGKTLYLGGTIHVLRDKDYPLPAQFDSVYKVCNELVFETDLEQMNNPSKVMEVMMKGSYQDGRTLKTVLNEEAYQALEKEFAAHSVPASMFASLKPSMAIVTLTMLKLKDEGVSSKGVDMHYHAQAKNDDKKETHLESFDEQLTLLTTMGDGNESEFVISSLKDMKRMKRDFIKMISSWKNGEIELFNQQIKEMKADDLTTYKQLLVNRNNSWIPKIEEQIKDQETEFILIGTLHLYGEDGLIKQLKDKGYTITQL